METQKNQSKLSAQKSPFIKWILIGGGIFAIVIIAVLAARGERTSQVTTPTQGAKQKTVGIIQAWRRLDRFPAGLKEGLKNLGYEEGRNIVYKYNSWEESIDKVDGIVQQYIDENVDLLFAVASPSALRALELTNKAGKAIPIIYVVVDQPNELGLVKNLNSSGNHVTGVLSNMADLVPKQLEIFKRINPNAKRIGVFNDGFRVPAKEASGYFVFAELQKHAPKFGLQLVEYNTNVPPGPDLDKEFTRIGNTIKPGDIDAIYHIPAHFISYQDVNEVSLGRKLKIINIMPIQEEVESSGGTFAISADSFEVGKQTAVMAEKIFRGIHPSDIPSEMPRKNIFVINVTELKELGINAPQEILDLADIKF